MTIVPIPAPVEGDVRSSGLVPSDLVNLRDLAFLTVSEEVVLEHHQAVEIVIR